jgi:hypothetical protein
LNGAYLSAATGGGSTTYFAESAAMGASKATALQSVSAGNLRASEKLYRKGTFFAYITAYVRRFAGRQGLCIAGAVLSTRRVKVSKSAPNRKGAAGCHF